MEKRIVAGIIDHVGQTSGYPWPHNFADECKSVGPSRRVSALSIPDLVPPYRIVFTHPRAGLRVASHLSLTDLWFGLVREGFAEGDCPRYREGNIEMLLADSCAGTRFEEVSYVSQMEPFWRALERAAKAREHKYLAKEFGLEYYEAAFGFSWITGAIWVCPEDRDETDMPEILRQKGIEPVRVVYEDRDCSD